MKTRRLRTVLLRVLAAAALAVSLGGCTGSPVQQNQGEEVTSTDNVKVEGIYVDTSHKSPVDKKLRLAYIFMTVSATDKNIEVASSSVDLKIGENQYNSHDSISKANGKWMPSYHCASTLKTVYSGETLKLLTTCYIPKNEWTGNKELSLSSSYIPNMSRIKMNASSIKVCKSGQEIAKMADPKGYKKAKAARDDVDAATAEKVKSKLNGYYFTFYPTVGTSIQTGRIEFEEPNKFSGRVFGADVSGTYSVKKGYIFLKNSSNKKTVEVPYSFKKGDVDADFGEAYSTS